MSMTATLNQIAMHDIATDRPCTYAAGQFAGESFDPVTYSRFKYGDGAATRHYARRMARLLVDRRAVTRDTTCLLTGSAYHVDPTAAATLAKATADLLRAAGYDIEYFRVHGDAYRHDYARLGVSGRRGTVSQIRLHLDTQARAALEDRDVIVIDDIRVTGLHSSAIEQLLLPLRPASTTFAYIARLDTESSASTWPGLEAHMNHAYVQSLHDVLGIARGDFRPNARVCKLVVSSSPAEVAALTARLRPSTLRQLATMIREDGYADPDHPSYRTIVRSIGPSRHRGPRLAPATDISDNR